MQDIEQKSPDVLGPVAILAALREPMPSVLQWLCDARQRFGAVVSERALANVASDTGNASDHSATHAAEPSPASPPPTEPLMPSPEQAPAKLLISNVPAGVTPSEVEACFLPFGAIPGTASVRPVDPRLSGAKHSSMQAQVLLVDAASALEALSTTHRLGPNGSRVLTSLGAPDGYEQPPCRKLYVSGFEAWVMAGHLTTHFAEYGQLTGPVQVHLSHAVYTGGRVRFAFVEFLSEAACADALKARGSHRAVLGESTLVAPARPKIKDSGPLAAAAVVGGTGQVPPPPPGSAMDVELGARRSAIWGVLDVESESRWSDEVRSRMLGGLVSRKVCGPNASRKLWRSDNLALSYYAGGGLPTTEHLASPGLAVAAPWQPLIVHSTQLGAQQQHAPGAVGYTALLLLTSECRLSHLKTDVAQQALTLPMVVQQLLWFARARLLQERVGVEFHDLNLLRRAFVHPTHGDRPETISREVGVVLTRTGTLAAQHRGRLRETLRARGLRRLIAKMEKQPLSKDAVMSAGVEYHNQRLEFLGDAVLEFVASYVRAH